MNPRNSHGFWMRIKHAGSKCAHDVSANLEGLMDRWWLVDCPGNWFKVLSIERERVEITVPANRIKWVLGQRHTCQSRSIFHENIDIFLLIDCNYLAGTMKIALRVRRAHF